MKKITTEYFIRDMYDMQDYECHLKGRDAIASINTFLDESLRKRWKYSEDEVEAEVAHALKDEFLSILDDNGINLEHLGY